VLKATFGGDQSVTVLGMSEHENDPAGSTQQFRAYVQRGAAQPAAKGGGAGLIVGVAAVVVIVAVVAGFVLVAL
jgi:hypothetical protein